MLSSTFFKLSAISCLIGLSTATPTPEFNMLEKKQDGDGRYWFNYQLCNSCGPSRGGFPICRNDPYFHNGDAVGHSSCDDRTVPFNKDFCSTWGGSSVRTPLGEGTWKAWDGCSQSNPEGTAAGYIFPADGSNGWVANCVTANSQSANSNCGGLQYSCSTALTCQARYL